MRAKCSECPKFSKKYKENGRVSDYCIFCSRRTPTIGKSKVFRHIRKLTKRFNKEVRESLLGYFEDTINLSKTTFSNKADIISDIEICFAYWGLDHNGKRK